MNTHIYRIFYPTTTKYTVFSKHTRSIFWERPLVRPLSIFFKKITLIPKISSDHNGIKLEIKQKLTSTRTLHNTLQNNQRAKGKIKGLIPGGSQAGGS